MKNQQKGFTLIELLVVIVIIGILATISTATFSGYFRKARDTERQTFVRNAQQIVIAATVSADTPDYRLGGTNAATVETAVEGELETQGYDIPATKNGISYYYFTNSNGSGAYDSAAADFIVFACKEDVLGTASGSITETGDVAFVAGTTSFANSGTDADGNLTPTELATICAASPTAPTAAQAGASWDVVALADS